MSDKYSRYIKEFTNVIWNVPILCENYDDLNQLNTGNKKFDYIAYGSPKCYFNCGRTGSDIGLAQVILNINTLNKKNIPCYVTFSNYNIEEKDLYDSIINQILDKLNKGKSCNNGVICSNELLRKYIKSNYPNLKLKASIILSTMLGKENDINWYMNQLDLYDYVVVHVDAILDTLKQLSNKDKFEILVNETCMKNCPYRKEHCYNTDKNTYEVLRYEHCISDKLEESQTCRMSLNEVQELIDLGFTNFKLQGRPYNNQLIKELLALEI